MKAIAKRVKEGRSEMTILDEAPVASPQSIGACERYHRALQEQCRTLRLELEDRLGATIQITTPLASWMVRHASWLIFRFAVSRELKSTAFYRLHGHSYQGTMASIFERVLARQPEDTTSGRKWSTWESRWKAGLWIGKQSQADDHLIVRNISEINGKTLECVVSAHRSIRRLQPNDPNRWDSREILQLMATPWTHKVSKMTLEQEKLKVYLVNKMDST